MLDMSFISKTYLKGMYSCPVGSYGNYSLIDTPCKFVFEGKVLNLIWGVSNVDLHLMRIIKDRKPQNGL